MPLLIDMFFRMPKQVIVLQILNEGKVVFVLHSFFQMLRKSVETRDWLNTIEPRNVRAVMKRVVEDITAIDNQVCHSFLRCLFDCRKLDMVFIPTQPLPPFLMYYILEDSLKVQRH